MGIYDRDYNREQTSELYGQQMRLALPALTPVVMWLLIINVSIFVMTYMLDPNNTFFLPWFSVFPINLITSVQIWRPITYQFLHGNFWHIFGNMLALYFFGPMLERQWGSKKFLTFYIICGAVGGVLYSLLVLINIMSVGFLFGASGAILGILAAASILFPNLRVYVFGVFPLKLFVLAIIFAAWSIMSMYRGENTGGEVAHLAGMATGAVYVLYRPWRQKIRSNAQRATWESKINQQRVFQQEVDRILDKINDSGIASLTRQEKKTLKQASQKQQNEKY